jgi:Fe-S cluster assembly protein SufD
LRWKWKIQLDNIKHEYVVEENQHQQYRFLIDETSNAHTISFCFYVERNADLVVEIAVAHTDVTIHVNCILQGQGACARIIGTCKIQSQRVVFTTTQHHQAPHTTSTLLVKSLLYDNASLEYHGTIRVEKDAVGAHASQENKNMVLSNSARVISVPSLEVLTHDVHCFHGSATGRFDDEQLFYAACRGIDEKVAQDLLAQAFLACPPVILRVPEERIEG